MKHEGVWLSNAEVEKLVAYAKDKGISKHMAIKTMIRSALGLDGNYFDDMKEEVDKAKEEFEVGRRT